MPVIPTENALRFLSTLPARGATLKICETCTGLLISIHAPREGSDILPSVRTITPASFLSTLPARGATGQFVLHFYSLPNFYPRSPRGERPQTKTEVKPMAKISIHAPREGSDFTGCRKKCGTA